MYLSIYISIYIYIYISIYIYLYIYIYIYISILGVCKSIFAWNSTQYVEAEWNKYFKRKKGRNYIFLTSLFCELLHSSGV